MITAFYASYGHKVKPINSDYESGGREFESSSARHFSGANTVLVSGANAVLAPAT